MAPFFWFDLFFEARAEIQKYFCLFLFQMKTLKFAFEIYWPLPKIAKFWFLNSWFSHKNQLNLSEKCVFLRGNNFYLCTFFENFDFEINICLLFVGFLDMKRKYFLISAVHIVIAEWGQIYFAFFHLIFQTCCLGVF